MFFSKITSSLSVERINKILENEEAVVISSSIIELEFQIKLADYLSKSSFELKTNIANKFKYEFLLWLTGKRDIKSAMAVSLPKGSDELFIVIFEDKSAKKILSTISAKPEKSILKKHFDSIRLDNISTSRV